MLNKIYIIVGFIAILLLVLAFLAPVFINWSDYRDRVEMIASEALGVDVAIDGDIDFSLLPLPTMSFNDVIVGLEEKPIAKISFVNAKFSLLDFLRDHYVITELNLSSPKIFLRIDKNGRFTSKLNIPKNFSASNISISNAKIIGGILQVFDERNDKSWLLKDFNGELQLGGLRGPFILDGDMKYQNKQYRVQVNSREFNERDEIYISTFLNSKSDDFSLKLDGFVKTAQDVKFNAIVEFRQKVKAFSEEQGARGDALFKSKVEISTKRILFPDYVFLPDENRPVTRLSGALDIILGKEPFYNLVISGGIVNLLGHDIDINKDIYGNKTNLMQVFSQMKMPFLPSLNGMLGLDISELNYKGMNFRNIRLDASSTENEWQIKKLEMQIFGKTSVSFNGVLISDKDKPKLVGNIKLDNQNLDVLALLLDKKYNSVFNIPASLLGRVSFFDGGLNFSKGQFIFDDVLSDVSFNIDKNHSLDIFADFGEFSAKQSQAIAKLIPLNKLTSLFDSVFKFGSFDIRTKKLVAFDVQMQSLEAKGSWRGESLIFENLKINEFGGVNFGFVGDFNIEKLGGFVGNGKLSLKEKTPKGALELLFKRLSVPKKLQQYLYASLPANLSFSLVKAKEGNAQRLKFSGMAGVAEISSIIVFKDGLLNYAGAPLWVDLRLNSSDAKAFSKQLGFGDLSLVEQDSNMQIELKIDGSIFNSLDVDISLSGDEEKTRFLGNIFVANAKKWKGKGKLEMLTNDITPFFESLGGEGLNVGNLNGEANLSFEGFRDIRLEEIDILIGGAQVKGNLTRRVDVEDSVNFEGDLNVSRLYFSDIAKLLGGSASLISYDGFWANGPFSIGQNIKSSTGRIKIKTPILLLSRKMSSENIAVDYVNFNFIWNDEKARISSFNAEVGNGNITGDVEFCCKSELAEKQLKGRINISNVDSFLLFPQSIANSISGKVNAGASFSGVGVSYADIIKNLIGEGSFTLIDAKIEQFSPLALSALSGVGNIFDISNDILETKIKAELQNNIFESNKITAVMNITNGILRANNISAVGNKAELLGDMQINLSDLSIKGFWRLSEILNEINNSHMPYVNGPYIIGVNIFGSLFAPKVEFDVSQLIDATKAQALEKEVKRLEKLQKEAQAARQEAIRAEAIRLEQERIAAAEKEKRKIELERIAREKRAAELNKKQNISPLAPIITIPPLAPLAPPVNLLPDPIY